MYDQRPTMVTTQRKSNKSSEQRVNIQVPPMVFSDTLQHLEEYNLKEVIDREDTDA